MAEDERPNHPAPYDAGRGTPAPIDPEQQRQFEQFQQFQQFMKFQEMQGQGQLPPAAPPSKTPVWKKILLSKAFRKAVSKLVVFALVVIGLVWAYNHYFGPPPDDNTVQGGAGPGSPNDPGREPGRPNEVVYTLYLSVERGEPKTACYLFTKEAEAAFARNFDAPDCAAAVAKLKPEVAALTRIPRVDTSGKQIIEVDSCTLAIKPGTTPLGTFTFTPFGAAWIISGHQTKECATTTPTTVPPTTVTSR